MFLSYDTIGYLKGPDIALVKDVETGTVAVRKKLRAELLGVYERLKSVEQANLPRVYETEEYEGECFAYYEYIEGETLEDIVHEGKYTIAQAEEWMEQLCAAFMHSEKLQAHARFLCSAGSLYLKRNGNLLFTLRPIGEVIDDHYASQLEELELAAERQRVANLLREQESPA